MLILRFNLSPAAGNTHCQTEYIPFGVQFFWGPRPVRGQKRTLETGVLSEAGEKGTFISTPMKAVFTLAVPDGNGDNLDVCHETDEKREGELTCGDLQTQLLS